MTSANKSATHGQLVLMLNRKVTLFSLMAFPVLLSLGIWQLQRAEEKREILEKYTQQYALSPVVMATTNFHELPDHRRVIAQGAFDNKHIWLIDNKQRQGRVGYEVVSLFKLTDGGNILVNRGWIAAGKTRKDYPVIKPVNGAVTIFAEVVSVESHPLLSAQSDQNDWPKIITAIEPEVMAQQLGVELLPRVLRLDETSAAALVTQWQSFTGSAEKHTGYAVQWFALALALVVWFIFANTNLLSYWRHKRIKTAKTSSHHE